MRMLTAAAGAAFLILAASPALAGGPTGGHPGGGRPGCGSCGGGGHSGGGGRNINVNVNANASASASAYAGASARSYLNARTYDVGGGRGFAGGGAVYVGGGYGGDAGGYYGAPIYNEAVYEGRACAPAPFGYVLGGFGRDERYAPVCGNRYYDDGDRGGRYGYSERHDGYAGSRYEESRYESYEEYGSFEARADYRDADHGRRDERHEDRGDAYFGAREYDRGYMDGRRDCDCRPDGRDGEPYVHAPEPAPYDYAPEAPPAPVYEAPMTPNQYYGIGGEAPPPPRQRYSQEPGERG